MIDPNSNTILIKAGDTVRVAFIAAGIVLCEKAIVRFTPSAPGEAWVLVDLETKVIHYVSEGCTITKDLAGGIYEVDADRETIGWWAESLIGSRNESVD